jgi:hypothetical protein
MGIAVASPGGDENSQISDNANGMDKYVHLCFLPQSPMAYTARENGRIKAVTFHQVSLDVLQLDGVKYVPGFSNTSGIPVYDIEEAWDQQMLDFEALYVRIDWSERPDVYRRRQAAEKHEILIPDHIPLDLILNLKSG